ncbi:hypothetical protein TRVL_09807 [Trypanosoma vivax]|nr:hypothetical protein TRVL_09807 [Trypanosoma vivax]
MNTKQQLSCESTQQVGSTQVALHILHEVLRHITRNSVNRNKSSNANEAAHAEIPEKTSKVDKRAYLSVIDAVQAEKTWEVSYAETLSRSRQVGNFRRKPRDDYHRHCNTSQSATNDAAALLRSER